MPLAADEQPRCRAAWSRDRSGLCSERGCLMPVGARIAGLFVYPVKGCAGHRARRGDARPRAAWTHDRRWMIVDAAGRYQSQRDLPQLATLQPTARRTASCAWSLDGASGSPRARWPTRASRATVEVWRDSGGGAGGRIPAATAHCRSGSARACGWCGSPRRAVRALRTRTMRRPAATPASPMGFPLLVTSAGLARRAQHGAGSRRCASRCR